MSQVCVHFLPLHREMHPFLTLSIPVQVTWQFLKLASGNFFETEAAYPEALSPFFKNFLLPAFFLQLVELLHQLWWSSAYSGLAWLIMLGSTVKELY